MSRLMVGAIVFAGMLGATHPGTTASSQRDASDDGSVVKAAVANVEDGKGGHPRAEPLPFLSQTVAVCDERHDQTCITQAQIEIFRPDRSNGPRMDSVGPEPGDAVPAAAVRDELIASLVSRNGQRHPWTGLTLPSFILIPAAEEQNVMVRDRDRSKYAGFSLPGYSKDNRALAYGFYACGARCGSGWLFLLEKSQNEWQVRSRYMVWIR